MIYYFGRLILLALPVAVVVFCCVMLFKLWKNPTYRQKVRHLVLTVARHPVGRYLQKVQFQMMVVFGISVLVFILATNISNFFFGRIISSVSMDYSNSINQVDSDTQQMVSLVENPSGRPYNNGQPMSVPAVLNQQAHNSNEQIYILNSTGKVLIASGNAEQTSVSLQKLIRESANTTMNQLSPGGTIVRMYPVTYQGGSDYLVVEGVPQPNLVYTQRNNPLSTVIGLAAFIFTFYQLSKRKVKYIGEISAGLHEIAAGNLDFRVQHRGRDELAQLAQDINRTASALQQTIEAERLAEKTKNELITNVSHDLRTPLTLIMGYLRLLKDRKFQDNQQFDTYVDIAYDKSEKLSNLIETLFEYTKLTNQGIRFDYKDVSINALLGQLMEELVSVAGDAGVEFRREFSDERMTVRIDPDHMSRVFENLLTNSIQHSVKPGQIIVRSAREGNDAVVTVVNQGNPIPPEELPRLFERFYRGDPARTSATGGAGLGLAIAKSIVELHGGLIHCECEGTEIRFIVKLPVQAVVQIVSSVASSA